MAIYRRETTVWQVTCDICGVVQPSYENGHCEEWVDQLYSFNDLITTQADIDIEVDFECLVLDQNEKWEDSSDIKYFGPHQKLLNAPGIACRICQFKVAEKLRKEVSEPLLGGHED